MNYFSHNLKLLRKWYKLTLKDFEKIVKKSYRTVSRWEAGYFEPADEDIHVICEHFGLTPADLMYRKLDEEVPYDEKSDIFKLISLCEKMNDKQFACLLAYAEGLVNASL